MELKKRGMGEMEYPTKPRIESGGGGSRFHVAHVPRFLLCAMRHLNFSQKGKFTPHTTHHTPHIQPYPTTTCYTTHQV